MNGEAREKEKTPSKDNQVYRGCVIYSDNAYMLVKWQMIYKKSHQIVP